MWKSLLKGLTLNMNTYMHSLLKKSVKHFSNLKVDQNISQMQTSLTNKTWLLGQYGSLPIHQSVNCILPENTCFI